MSYKSILIFFAGVAVGASGVLVYDHFFKNSEGENHDSESDLVCETHDREVSDSSWTESDRERVFQFLDGSNTFVEPSDLSSEDTAVETGGVVSSIVNTVEESNDGIVYSDSFDIMQDSLGKFGTIVESLDLNSLETDENGSVNHDSDDLSVIDAVEFVKAIASGANMRSFIFNPVDQKLYWNFTDEPLSEYEINSLVTSGVVDDILNESNGNLDHSITPKYLYNKIENVYTKIETGVVF